MYGAKDVGYGIGHKLSNAADTVKQQFVGGEHDYGYERRPSKKGWFGTSIGASDERAPSRGWFGRDDQQRGGISSGGWFGRSGDEYQEEDELHRATEKMKRISSQAEREL